jgi:hypothetical protein
MVETMTKQSVGGGPSAGFARRWQRTILPAMLLLSACYTYGAPHGPAPQRGTHVSIRLSGDASRDLTLELGPSVSYVEGVVLADDSAGLHLAVSRVEGRGEGETSWTGERVTFPHDTYLSLEERHLNVPGTMLFGGLAVGAVVAIHEAFGNGSTANTPPGTIGGPSQ